MKKKQNKLFNNLFVFDRANYAPVFIVCILVAVVAADADSDTDATAHDDWGIQTDDGPAESSPLPREGPGALTK